MKISLTVFERIVFLNMVPREGLNHELDHIKEVNKSLSIDNNEQKKAAKHEQELYQCDKCGYVPPGKRTDWDAIESEIPEKEIELDQWLWDSIEEDLRKLEKTRKLTLEKHTIYKKITKPSG